MAVNYEEEIRRGQQTLGGSSSVGANAFRAAYDRLKGQAEETRAGIKQDYASTYQKLRGQQYAQGLGAAAQRGLSGGQQVGAQQQLGAQQMGQLGQFMQGQERALREQKLGEASIYSNALLEGQQAQQIEQQQQQFATQQQQQISAIQNDKTLTEEQKQAQIAALTGGNTQTSTTTSGPRKMSGWEKWRVNWELGTGGKLEYQRRADAIQDPVAKSNYIKQFKEERLQHIMNVGNISRAQAIAITKEAYGDDYFEIDSIMPRPGTMGPRYDASWTNRY